MKKENKNIIYIADAQEPFLFVMLNDRDQEQQQFRLPLSDGQLVNLIRDGNEILSRRYLEKLK
tara:strand:+ start:137 stop:325 length:189 start_codon:yes stop_codon:yes gene_type:complete